MRPPRRLSRQRGSSVLEFALAFVVLYPVFYGTFQFGYTFLLYNELHSAVRAGARYASYRTYDSASSTPSTAFASAVRNVVVYGSPAGGTTPVVRGLTPANVAVTVRYEAGVPRNMSIGIQNFSVNAVFQTFTLNKPTVTFPFTGVYAPL